jgi:hypothetical protein
MGCGDFQTGLIWIRICRFTAIKLDLSHLKESIMRTAHFALAVLLLAGCSTPEQRALARQAEMDQMMVEFGPACTRLGYAAGSDQWRSCVLQLDAKADLERYGTSYYAGMGRGYRGMGARSRWGPW